MSIVAIIYDMVRRSLF